eukprot:scaffold2668_cov115-Isochrysis_galbana.AAC.28
MSFTNAPRRLVRPSQTHSADTPIDPVDELRGNILSISASTPRVISSPQAVSMSSSACSSPWRTIEDGGWKTRKNRPDPNNRSSTRVQRPATSRSAALEPRAKARSNPAMHAHCGTLDTNKPKSPLYRSCRLDGELERPDGGDLL